MKEIRKGMIEEGFMMDSNKRTQHIKEKMGIVCKFFSEINVFKDNLK